MPRKPERSVIPADVRERLNWAAKSSKADLLNQALLELELAYALVDAAETRLALIEQAEDQL